MKGYNHDLVITTVEDPATGEDKPLFHFPVQVCKAVDEKEVGFDSAAPSGAPRKRCWRDSLTGEVFEEGDTIKGVRNGDSFAAIPAEAIAKIEAAAKSDAIRVERCIDLDEVPFDRIVDRNFLQVPAKGGSATSYRGVYESLLARPKKGKVAARPARALRVKFVSTTREKLGVIYADPSIGCLMLLTVRFGAVIREPDAQVLAPLQAEVPEAIVEKISAVLDGLDDEEAGDFDTAVDSTLAQRAELIEQALAGDVINVPEPDAAPVLVEDLSAVLEASLAGVA